MVKRLPAMWDTQVRSLGWEDSPGEWKGYPLQYSGLKNSMNCIVHEMAKRQTTERLSLFHFHKELLKINKKIIPRQPNKKLGKNASKSVSVRFSCSVVSDSLQSHESQHARPPCLREMQIKIRIRYDYTHTRMANELD